MQLHKDWLLKDLKQLNADRYAVTQLRSELETVKLEMTALKATSYDKLPSGAGGNSQQDKIENALAKQEELTASLKATESHVADMERLLSQLPKDDRTIVERLVISRGSADEIAEEIGIEIRQIYRRRNSILDTLLNLRFGQGYRP